MSTKHTQTNSAIDDFKRLHREKFEATDDLLQRTITLGQQCADCLRRLDSENKALRAEIAKMKGGK